MKKVCGACGTENPQAARFCIECGIPLPVCCPSCGAEAAAKSKFCMSCGHSLSELNTPRNPADPAQATAFVPPFHTPEHIAERVLRNRRSMEGERKSVTVLFADIKGSTSLIEHRDPEEARQIIRPIIQAMIDAVHRFDGVVSKVMGDGLMALFGAPLALEDHAVRACYAALAMRQSIQGKSTELLRSRGLEVQVRIGLNSGEVVVLGVGTDLHMDYDAVGATVHLAARMEQIAPAGSIRLTENSARLIKGQMSLDDLGLVPVAGFSDPIRVFNLSQVGDIQESSEAASALPRFVGRDTELQLLEDISRRVTSARGHAVVVMGEPGIGKSRLCAELVRRLGASGWMRLTTRAAPHEGSEPWFAIRRMLRAQFGAGDETEMAQHAASKLRERDSTLDAAVPALLDLMGLQIADPKWQALEPVERRQRMIDACRGWIIAESKVRPVVVFADDLQWIDTESRALLHSIADVVGNSQILLLLASRDARSSDLLGGRHATHIRVAPLDALGSAKLLDEVAADIFDLDKRGRVMERAGGNPLFLCEIVRALGDGVETNTLPPTVQAIIAARIDALPGSDKVLLQAASVLGEEFRLDGLIEIIGANEDEVRTALVRLHAQGFVLERRVFPEIEFGFDNPLVMEVAYRGMLKERRAKLHSNVISHLEGKGGSGSVLVGQLAHHAWEAKRWDKAARYCGEAARRAAGHSAYQEGVVLYHRALEALAHTRSGAAMSEEEIDLQIELRHVLFPLGKFAEIGEVLDKALSAAEARGDDTRIGLVLTHATTHHLGAGRYRNAIGTGERALAIADESRDPTIARDVLFRLVQAHASIGGYKQAVELCTRILEISPNGPSGLTTSSLARMWLAWCQAELGDFEAAHGHAEEALAIVRTTDQPLPALLAHLGRGLIHLRQEQFEPAVVWLEFALTLSKRPALNAWWRAVGSPLGRAWVGLARVEQAIELLERVVTHSAASGGTGHVLRIVHLGEAYLSAGRGDEARQAGSQALTLARSHDERSHEAYSLLLLAEVAASELRWDEAVEAGQSAADIAMSLGMTPLKARVQRLLDQTVDRHAVPTPIRVQSPS